VVAHEAELREWVSERSYGFRIDAGVVREIVPL
jgi:hypothetical protein